MAENNPNVMAHAQQKINGENQNRPSKFVEQEFGQSSLEYVCRIQAE